MFEKLLIIFFCISLHGCVSDERINSGNTCLRESTTKHLNAAGTRRTIPALTMFGQKLEYFSATKINSVMFKMSTTGLTSLIIAIYRQVPGLSEPDISGIILEEYITTGLNTPFGEFWHDFNPPLELESGSYFFTVLPEGSDVEIDYGTRVDHFFSEYWERVGNTWSFIGSTETAGIGFKVSGPCI